MFLTRFIVLPLRHISILLGSGCYKLLQNAAQFLNG